MFFWVFIALIVLGIVLLQRGFAGRLVSNNPHCIKCRFDLGGVWPKAERCPECGGLLQPYRHSNWTVSFGRREKRRASIIFGFVCLGLAGSMFVVSASGRFSKALDKYKPTELLVMQLVGPLDKGDYRAAEELMRRTSAGDIKQTQARRIADRILNASLSDDDWAWAIGDVFEDFANRGMLTDEQLRDYVRESTDRIFSTTTFSPRVRPGDVPDVRWTYTGNAPLTYASSLAWGRALESITLDGEQIELSPTDPDEWGRFTAPYPSALFTGNRIPWNSECGPLPQLTQLYSWPTTLDAEPGEHTIAVTFRFWLIEAGRADPVIDTWTKDLQGRFEVVPTSESIAALITPTGDRERRIREAVTWTVEVEDIAGFEPFARLALEARALPLPIVADVEWRDDNGNRGTLGTLRLPTGHGGMHYDITDASFGQNGFDPPPDGVKTVTLILTPNPEAAPGLPVIEEIYGGELVFENVPVRR